MKKTFKKIIVISFILYMFILLPIFSISFANNIDLDLGSQTNKITTQENSSNNIANENVKATVTSVNSSEDTFLTTTNILNILLIVIGIVLILLGIAILIRCK